MSPFYLLFLLSYLNITPSCITNCVFNISDYHVNLILSLFWTPFSIFFQWNLGDPARGWVLGESTGKMQTAQEKRGEEEEKGRGSAGEGREEEGRPTHFFSLQDFVFIAPFLLLFSVQAHYILLMLGVSICNKPAWLPGRNNCWQNKAKRTTLTGKRSALNTMPNTEGVYLRVCVWGWHFQPLRSKYDTKCSALKDWTW